MTPKELHSLVGGNGSFRPFIIRTKSGALYAINDSSQLWFPGPYSETVCVALARQGITVLAIAAIEAVQLEVET
jgi:hypothetical protein